MKENSVHCLPVSPQQVMIWDDNQTRCIGELTFRSDVRAVRLRRDCIVVVLEFKVYVYNFANLKLMHQVCVLMGLPPWTPDTSPVINLLLRGSNSVKHKNVLAFFGSNPSLMHFGVLEPHS